MVADAFEKMAQPGFIKEVGTILGGYGFAGGIDFVLDEFTQRDIPGEISGVAAVAGLQYAPVASGQRMRRAQVGAGVFAGMSLAERVGIADAITEAI
jgi:hypothetical protein